MSDLPHPFPTFKALFTDLDGTAIPKLPEGMPSPRVIEAIKKAKHHAYISVATGRPLSMCRYVLEALELDTLCVIEGGTQIYDAKTKQIVWEQALSAETISEIKAACEPYEFFPTADDAAAASPADLLFTGTNRMMVVLSAGEPEVDRLMTNLQKIPEINALKVHSWREGKWDIHISHIGASKRHALEVLLGMVGLESHEVIGVGDSHNDLPLFEAAGFKVAMGNAIDELKDQADFVAPTVGEDGLAVAIEKFLL